VAPYGRVDPKHNTSTIPYNMQKQRVVLAPRLLPNYTSDPIVKFHMRYSCGVLSVVNITPRCLLNMLVVGCTGLGTDDAASIISSVRIKRIEVVANAPVVQTASLTTVGVTWQGTNSSLTEKTASGNSNMPARLQTSPPPNSSSSWWFNSSSSGVDQSIFTLSVSGAAATTPSTFVDIWVDAVLNDGNPVTTIITASATTDGVLYSPYLDNTTTAGAWRTAPSWAPVDRVTHI
jgi:hypothetical protein